MAAGVCASESDNSSSSSENAGNGPEVSPRAVAKKIKKKLNRKKINAWEINEVGSENIHLLLADDLNYPSMARHHMLRDGNIADAEKVLKKQINKQ